MRHVLYFLCVLFAGTCLGHAQDNKEKLRILDEKILPLIREGTLPPAHALKGVEEAVKAYNTVSATPVDKTVESLDPMWLRTRLNEYPHDSVALSLCGAELPSCTEASERLRSLTAQCPSTKVLLAIIDLDRYPHTSRNLYDLDDPTLILLERPPESRARIGFNMRANVNQNTIAMVLCPEHSKSFGHILRSFGSGN